MRKNQIFGHFESMNMYRLMSNLLYLFIFCVSSSIYHTAKAQADFTATPTSGCTPLLVNFNATCPGCSGFSVTGWSFGGAGGSPAFVYNTPGSFDVTMNYTLNGVPGSVTKTGFITVFESPSVDFIANDVAICEGEMIDFTSTITGGAPGYTYTWSTGACPIANTANTNCTYNISGLYDIALLVGDANGCTGTETKTQYVNVEKKPVADFTVSYPIGSCNPPITATFAWTQGNTPAGSTHLWDFGDPTSGANNNSSQPNPTHNYMGTGTFSIIHIVTSPSGCIDTFLLSNGVTIGFNTPQVIISDTTPCVNIPINFTATPFTGMTYSWTATGASPASGSGNSVDFTFISAGNQTVNVDFTFGGCTVSQSFLLTVDQGPSFTTTISDSSGCVTPFLTQLTVNSGSPLNLGITASPPGGVSIVQASQTSYNMTFNNLGTYDITINATNLAGCNSITVLPDLVMVAQPDASFQNNQGTATANLCTGQSVTFTSTSYSGGSPIVSYSWAFPGGTPASSTLPNPSVSYSAIGNYNVSLTITNADGCTDNYTCSNCVKVGGSMQNVDFFLNAASPMCAGTQVSFLNNSQPACSGATGVTAQWKYAVGSTIMGYSTNCNGNWITNNVGTFNVTLIMNNNGCKDSVKKNNQFIVSGPVAAFNVTPSVVCSTPAIVTFTDSVFGGAAATCSWNFGNGQTSTSCTPPAQTYTTSGTYPVSYTVTGGNNCTNTQTINLFIGNVKADFTTFPPATSGICAGATVNFIPDIPAGLNYAWNFGDPASGPANNTSLLAQPFHIYNTPGIYLVSLIVNGNQNLCQDTFTQTLNITGPTTINAMVSDDKGCFPMPSVTFTGSIGSITPPNTPITSWDWDFGDGNTGSGQTPSHTYTNDGAQTVTLTVTDANGCVVSTAFPAMVTIGHPVAAFNADYPVNCIGNPVNFVSTSTDIPGVGLVYNWNYGPFSQQAPNLTNPSYSYTSNGVYGVSLSVTDNLGCKDSINLPAYITISPFEAEFTVDNTGLNCPPLFSTYSPIINSAHVVNQLTACMWYFNPGVSTQYSPTYPYFVPGTFSTTLYITSAAGCKDTVIKTDLITIGGPTASINITPSTACPFAPVSLQATNTSADNIIEYRWITNGGNPGTVIGQNTSATYSLPGVYFPQIQIKNDQNCTVLMPPSDSVIIWNPATAEFTADNTIICVPGQATFTSITQAGDAAITDLQWNTGITSGLTSSFPSNSISENYSTTGFYDIMLIATDANGCKDTMLKPDYVAIVENIPPTPVALLRTSVLSDNEINLNYGKYNNLTGDFVKYVFLRETNNAGSYTIIGTETDINVLNFTDNTVSTFDNTYRYVVQIENGCGAFSANSNAHTPINVSSIPLNGAIKLTWTPYTGWVSGNVSNYNLYRVNDYDTTNVTLLGTIPANAPELTFTDSTTIRCHEPRTYRVEAIQAQTGRNSWSDTTTNTPDIAINPLLHIKNVTVENNNSIGINWNKPANLKYLSHYILSRETPLGSGAFTQIANIPATDSTHYQDVNVSISEQVYSYMLTGMDSCGNVVEAGRKGQNMLLQVVSTTGAINLTWTPYQEWLNGVLRYRIVLYDEAGQQWVTIDSTNGATLNYVDDEVRFSSSKNCYRIIAVEKNGGKAISMSNEACGALEPFVFIPTIFTPNGDNVNDIFIIKGGFAEKFNLFIFDRQGSKIFESQNINEGWNGKIKGQDAPEGVYVFTVEVISISGEKKTKTGTVTLIR